MSIFKIPAQVILGRNALEEAVPGLRKLGKRAFIVTGKHVGKSSMMERLLKTLEKAEIAYVLFDGITGEPTDTMIEEGVWQYKESKADFVIGMGGGSPLDSAKAIAAMSVCPGAIADYNGKEIAGELPGIVAIPTTAGTGSETTKFTIITDEKTDVKMLLKGDVLLPDLAIINPEFTVDMPKSVTASTGLDALTHAVEAFTSKKAFEMTDVYAKSAITRIMKYLPIAYRNGLDYEAREQMAIAAYEAGVCINNSSVTLVHGMSRPIGALFHVPHGLSNAMLLCDCLEFALDGALERFAELGYLVGAAQSADSCEEAAAAFLASLRELIHICEVPTFTEYGIAREDFLRVVPKMAADAIASGSPLNTRKTITVEDCEKIYGTVM